MSELRNIRNTIVGIILLVVVFITLFITFSCKMYKTFDDYEIKIYQELEHIDSVPKLEV